MVSNFQLRCNVIFSKLLELEVWRDFEEIHYALFYADAFQIYLLAIFIATVVSRINTHDSQFQPT